MFQIHFIFSYIKKNRKYVFFNYFLTFNLINSKFFHFISNKFPLANNYYLIIQKIHNNLSTYFLYIMNCLIYKKKSLNPCIIERIKLKKNLLFNSKNRIIKE